MAMLFVHAAIPSHPVFGKPLLYAPTVAHTWLGLLCWHGTRVGRRAAGWGRATKQPTASWARQVQRCTRMVWVWCFVAAGGLTDLWGAEVWPLLLNQEVPCDWVYKEGCGGISGKVCSFFPIEKASKNILKYPVNEVSLPQQQKNRFGSVNTLEPETKVFGFFCYYIFFSNF